MTELDNRLVLIKNLLYTTNCFESKSSCQTKKGLRTGSECKFEKGPLQEPVLCMQGDGTDDSVKINPLLLNVSDRTLVSCANCDASKIDQYISQHTFETKCAKVSYLFHCGEGIMFEDATKNEIFHTKDNIYTHTDPEWEFDISASKRVTVIIECPAFYPVNNYCNADSIYRYTTEERYGYRRFTFLEKLTAVGTYAVVGSFDATVLDVEKKENGTYDVFTSEVLPISHEHYKTFLLSEFGPELVVVNDFVLHFGSSAHCQFSYGFNTTKKNLKKNDTLRVEAQLNVIVTKSERTNTNKKPLSLDKNRTIVLPDKRGLSVSDAEFVTVGDETYDLKLKHNDEHMQHTTIILPPSEFEFQGMQTITPTYGRQPTKSCNTVVRLKIVQPQVSPFQLNREMPLDWDFAGDNLNIVKSKAIKTLISSPSQKKTLYAWLRMDANMAMTSLSLQDNMISLHSHNHCVEFKVERRENIEEQFGVSFYSPTQGQGDLAVSLDTKTGICTIDDTPYFVLKTNKDDANTYPVGRLNVASSVKSKGDVRTMTCNCQDPKKALLTLTVEKTEYLIANTRKRIPRDTNVSYFFKKDDKYVPITPIAMPATTQYNRMQMYLMDEDLYSYSKLSVRCMPRLCSGNVVEYGTIMATDNSTVHVFESMTIAAIVELDADHVTTLATQEAPSGKGNIYKIDSSQTRLVADYNLPTGLVLRGEASTQKRRLDDM